MNKRKCKGSLSKPKITFQSEKFTLKCEKFTLKCEKGITLIALVITIIVMLILAGVSLNATIGENGIMAQAKNVTYMQSVAVLEEFMQEQYVNLYDSMEEPENKIEYFLNDVSETKKYIQKAINNNYYFMDNQSRK